MGPSLPKYQATDESGAHDLNIRLPISRRRPLPINLLLATTIVVMVVVLRQRTAAQEAGPVRATLLPGGGVADPTGKIGFLSNPTGGLDAVDLASGKVLWMSRESNRPLLASADRVFVQVSVPGKANEVTVVVMEKDSGKKLMASQPIEFPDWVSVNPVWGRTFRSSAQLHKHELFLVWEAGAFYNLGRRPTPEEEKAARKNAAGVVAFDFRANKVAALEKDRIPKRVPTTPAGEPQSMKLGDWTFTMETKQVTRRWFQATSAAGMSWEKELSPRILPRIPR